MSNKKTQKVLAYIGFLLAVLSIYLAVKYQYKNFYEILVLGLFLAFKPLVGKRITRPMYFALYGIFFIAGVISDLVMGIYLTGLWHYTYNHLWEYAVLYLIIYPVAGLVMVQSYVIIKNNLLKIRNRGRKRPLLTIKAYKYIGMLLAVLLAIDIVEVLNKRSSTNLVAFFLISSLIAFLALSFVSQEHGHNTVIEDIHRHPAKSLLLLLSATYINALIHEVPNTYAHQWVYTNWPLENVRIASIPLVVLLLLWPLLLIVPVAGYYLILPKRANKPTKHRRATT